MAEIQVISPRRRAEYVTEGEYILRGGYRREVTETGRSQRWIHFWLDGATSVNPTASFLEDERVTVVA